MRVLILDLGRVVNDRSLPVRAAVDASVKRDPTAVVAVTFDRPDSEGAAGCAQRVPAKCEGAHGLRDDDRADAA